MVLFEKARHGMENALHGKKVNITEAKKAKKKVWQIISFLQI